MPGNVIPNGGAGAVTVNNHLTVNGADPADASAKLAPLLEENRRRTIADIVQMTKRGRL